MALGMPGHAPDLPPARRDHGAGMWRAFQPLVWVFALVCTLAWLPSFDASDWPTILALVALGNLADIFAVRVQRGMRVSAAHFAAPFAIIASTVAGGLFAAAGCLMGRLLFNRRDWNTFDVAVNLAATSVAGASWELARQVSGDAIVGPSVATVVMFAVVRSAINLGWAHEARAKGIVIPPVTVPVGRLMLAAAMLFTPAIALYRIDHSSHVSALMLFALPFGATQFLVRAFGRERELNAELEAANISLTESLVNALDARDPYSAGHSVAVAVYSRDIAAEIGLHPSEVQRIYLAGLLHDIGKIAVPDAILRKPAALTDDEFDEIRKHPVVGEQILAPSGHLVDLLPGVRHHHERIDGKGYPDRLRDDKIPLPARIIAVADAYNAMTSDRPYRDAMPPDLAVRILVQGQGMQHDAFLVSAFRRVLAQNGSEYAIAIGHDFATSASMRDLAQDRDSWRTEHDVA